MRKIVLTICVLICLVGLSFVQAPVDFHQVKLEDDTDPLHPEDYLFYVEDMSDEMLEKFAGEGLKNKDCIQRKTSDLYIAENTIWWAEVGRIKTQIMVGEPDYWEDFELRGEERFDRVSELEGLGDKALSMESGFEDEIRFIKGNSFVKVSIVGGEIVDIMPVAEQIEAALPQEMPKPDRLALNIPSAAYDIQLPSKYIFNIYKNGKDHTFYEKGPDADKMYLVSRYPFTKYTMGLWSVDESAYVLLEQKTLSIYDLWVLSAEHNGRAFGISPGQYELHYWVNGEFAANYPYRVVGVNEEQ